MSTMVMIIIKTVDNCNLVAYIIIVSLLYFEGLWSGKAWGGSWVHGFYESGEQFSVDGVMARGILFVKRLAKKLAFKWSKSCSVVMGLVQASLSFARLCATKICLRGPRRRWRSGFKSYLINAELIKPHLPNNPWVRNKGLCSTCNNSINHPI